MLEAIIVASLLTVFMWLPYLIGASISSGVPALLSANPKKQITEIPEWASRLQQAHQNAIENLPAFVAVCLVAVLVSQESGQAVNSNLDLAAYVFCAARAAHYLCYGFGIPMARTLFFMLSWMAIVYIGLATLMLLPIMQ